MKRVLLSAWILCLTAVPTASQIDEDLSVKPFPTEESQPFNLWMDVKLKKSQDIFAALAQANFDQMIACAKRLRAVSEFEGFVRKGIPGYQTQLKSFQFAVAEIEKQARQHNIEGATLGFQQLTASCVNCHNALRSANPKPDSK